MNMVVHPQVVTDAHMAACAAGKQKKFLEYKHDFWDKGFAPYSQSGGKDRSSMAEDNLLKIGADLGLDTTRLKADMHGEDCKKRLAGDMEELRKFHVNGTPAFFINGQHVGGGIPKEAFQQIIDAKLKIAEASGVSGAEYYDKEIMGKGLKQFKGAPEE